MKPETATTVGYGGKGKKFVLIKDETMVGKEAVKMIDEEEKIEKKNKTNLGGFLSSGVKCVGKSAATALDCVGEAAGNTVEAVGNRLFKATNGSRDKNWGETNQLIAVIAATYVVIAGTYFVSTVTSHFKKDK